MTGYLAKGDWYVSRAASLPPMQLIHGILTDFRADFTEPGASILQSAIRFELDILGYFGNTARLAIAVLFFVTFMSKPFIMRLSPIWRRVTGSRKPLFTLALGGGASIVVAVWQIAKHL